MTTEEDTHTLSESGTSVELKLVLALLAGTVTVTIAAAVLMVRSKSAEDSVTRFEKMIDETTEVTSELSRNVVIVTGDIRQLSEKIVELQIDNKQIDRDAQSRTATVVRMQSDLEALKERQVSQDSVVRALEARVLAIEIASASRSAGSSSGSPPAARGSSE